MKATDKFRVDISSIMYKLATCTKKLEAVPKSLLPSLSELAESIQDLLPFSKKQAQSLNNINLQKEDQMASCLSL